MNDLTCLENEEWRPIDGYESLYEISNLGRIKSLKRIIYNCSLNKVAKFSCQQIIEIKNLYVQIRNYKKIAEQFDIEPKSIRKIILDKNQSGYGNITVPEKIRTQHIGATGYWRIGLRRFNKAKQYFVHRLLAKAFIPNPENKPQINHKNGIKTDNRLENLEWCTNKENSLHSWANGFNRSCKGELHKSSKLKSSDVITIRNKFNSRESRIIDLAKDYNLSQASIAKIVYRKSWKHI